MAPDSSRRRSEREDLFDVLCDVGILRSVLDDEVIGKQLLVVGPAIDVLLEADGDEFLEGPKKRSNVSIIAQCGQASNHSPHCSHCSHIVASPSEDIFTHSENSPGGSDGEFSVTTCLSCSNGDLQVA